MISLPSKRKLNQNGEKIIKTKKSQIKPKQNIKNKIETKIISKNKQTSKKVFL